MSICSTKILWTFKERVKEERKKNNITQAELAESTKVSIDTIKRIESGQGVKLDIAYKIAEILNVPLESLLPQQEYMSDDELIARIHAAQQTLQLLLEKLHKK